MTPISIISINVCIHESHKQWLCNDTYHITAKMKSIDIKKSAYFDFDVDNNDKDPKYRVCNHLI